jgi:hypothetical protein
MRDVQVVISDATEADMLTRMWNPAGFEVIEAVLLNGFDFWDIMSCSPMKVKRSFGMTCCSPL